MLPRVGADRRRLGGWRVGYAAPRTAPGPAPGPAAFSTAPAAASRSRPVRAPPRAQRPRRCDSLRLVSLGKWRQERARRVFLRGYFCFFFCERASEGDGRRLPPPPRLLQRHRFRLLPTVQHAQAAGGGLFCAWWTLRNRSSALRQVVAPPAPPAPRAGQGRAEDAARGLRPGARWPGGPADPPGRRGGSGSSSHARPRPRPRQPQRARGRPGRRRSPAA